MTLFFYAVIFFLLFALGSYGLKRLRLKRIQAMFLRYNQKQDVQIIVEWISERDSAARMLQVLEYLSKIEAYPLLIQVYNAFEFDFYPRRAIRVLAAQAFLQEKQKEPAIRLSQALLTAYPEDDSIRDLFLRVHLEFGELDPARAVLLPRIEKKFKGTIFARHYAKLLAAEGHFHKAAVIMRNVTERDHGLYRNTFASMQKRLIYQQYVESQTFLDELEQKLKQET